MLFEYNWISLRRCPCDHWLNLQSAFKRYHSDKHLSEFYPQDGGKKINWHRYGTKLRHCHPTYKIEKYSLHKNKFSKKHQNFRATGSGWPISGYASTALEYRWAPWHASKLQIYSLGTRNTLLKVFPFQHSSISTKLPEAKRLCTSRIENMCEINAYSFSVSFISF